jgi:hypothetical protein
MRRQTYKGSVTWIIVDDANPRTTDNVKEDFRPDWTIQKIHPQPFWMPGQNTQARNIIAGVNFIKAHYTRDLVKAIFIIEDDDYYKPVYLESMFLRMGDRWAIGEVRTIYYNVQYRKYITNPNTGHSSLFQTALSWDGIPALESSFRDKFIDAKFWTIVHNKHLFSADNLAVGMKGMPGRGGIGAGHSRAMNMHPDIEMRYLTRLIGKEDARLYERYYGGGDQPQHDILTKKRI